MAVLARLGLDLSMGPGGTTALWLPSGLALTSLMAWGPRSLPGLLLGSVASDTASNMGQGLAPMAAIGLGLLMATVGALQWGLVRALAGRWDRLQQQPGLRGVRRFVGAVSLGGALAPSLGVPLLLLTERLSASGAPGAWLTWWVGDVTGMLLLAPLLLLALYPGSERQTALGQALPAISVGLGLTLLCSYFVGQAERAGDLQRAGAEVRMVSSALQAQVELAESDLRHLAALHRREPLSDEEFHRTTEGLRHRHAWLSSLGYLRRLSDEQRPAYERERELGLRTLDEGGRLVTAPVQPRYWVTERINPSQGHESRLGLDEGGDPARRAAIDAAVRSGEVTTSSVLGKHGFGRDEALAVSLYAPVHESPNAGSASPPVTGVVSAGLQLKTLLTTALAPFAGWEMPLLLVSDDPLPRGLEWRDGRVLELDANAMRDRLGVFRQGMPLAHPVALGQRQWQVFALPTVHRAGLPSLLQWGTLGIGLLCTSLWATILAARSRRDAELRRSNAELERLVGVRTQDWARSNEELSALAESLAAQTQTLAQREAVLNAVLRSLPDPLWVKDAQGVYLEANPALANALNRSPSELLGHTTRDLFPPEQADLDDEADRLTRESGEPTTRRQRALDAHGRLRTYRVTRSNVRLEDGSTIGLVGLARDITDDLAREDEMRRFRWLTECASQGFALGHLDGRVDYLNGVAQRWLGETQWPPATPPKAPDNYDEDGLLRLRNDVMPALRRDGHWTGEMPVRGLPGAQVPPVLVSYLVLRDERGKERALAMTMTDLSEQHRMEVELAQARDRAEAANRAKSVFLANMSHEIRTPLNAVLGYAQLLKEQRELPAVAQTQVASILSGGQRLLRLINDVLDLSKIEAGALQLVAEPFDVRRELDEGLRFMAERARRSRVSLEHDVAIPPGVVALGDRGKLGQVLLNLLGNAIKFTPAGGRVGLQARLDANDVAHVQIQDTGPGIAPEELAQLFTPFVQGRSGASQGGTGLGLVLSRNLLRAMGGELTLHSELGAGVRASITLPLQRLAQTSEAGNDPGTGAWQLAPGQRLDVLVAEDDPDSRTVLCQLLQNMGVTVWAAEDGEAAWQLALQHPMDAVLTDLRMPRRDGVALMQALKADPARQTWPVVAVTASSLVHERDSYLAMGFADYVAKPYEFQRIVDVLRKFTAATWQPRDPSHLPTQPTVDAAEHPASSPNATGEPPAQILWGELLAWSDDGDVVALREWLHSKGAQQLPPATLAALREALARYDFDRLTACLREAQAASPEGSA
ncbi:MAG: ATP-binding protein [Inhella sp.]|uniref:ATP-binding protein n=1 Tax=Inhella sp. TaxID=1921806 RepID=UPI0022C3829C|nr:ATP-binding protein [Inhella sp.]MCZ8236655.1 ATP-binding protein [Inhella sp.]